MNAKQFLNLLINLDACRGAKEWAEGKDWKEVYETCHRGDWLLWLFARTNMEDKRLLILAAAHCANTVRHLMKDKRSTKAVDTFIAYAEGKATDEELISATNDAADAAASCYDTYSAAAAAANAANAVRYSNDDVYEAAYYAAFAVADVADDAFAAAFVADAAADADAAANKQQTADICRQYLPFEIWNI